MSKLLGQPGGHDDAHLHPELERYLSLLRIQEDSSKQLLRPSSGPTANLGNVPLFSWQTKEAVKQQHGHEFTQYALLGNVIDNPLSKDPTSPDAEPEPAALAGSDSVALDPVFVNTNVPFSAFICGKQGSGKSYTLSCMLEGCFLSSKRLGRLPQPISGMVFNYDSQSINVAEAAYLCSAGVRVTVFVSPSNFATMKNIYDAIPGADKNVTVKPLYLNPSHLTTERMKRLMAFGDSSKDPPLYMQTVIKTLRQMALDNNGAANFDYDDFRKRIFSECFTGQQSGPLELRLDLLESFMEGTMVDASRYLGLNAHTSYGDFVKNPKPKMIKKITRNKLGGQYEVLAGVPGQLTIIDLTDPVIDSESACVLFDICLAIFLEKTQGGKVLALDEAHNYISNKGAASENFTNNILKAVREQRHKGARIIVATQEPTISPKFLDLCSMTIVHAFDSPDWFAALKGHLRGASSASGLREEQLHQIFNAIGDLAVGESLLFSSQALLDIDENGRMERLGGRHKKMVTRLRLSKDGGQSVVASDQGSKFDGDSGSSGDVGSASTDRTRSTSGSTESEQPTD